MKRYSPLIGSGSKMSKKSKLQHQGKVYHLYESMAKLHHQFLLRLDVNANVLIAPHIPLGHYSVCYITKAILIHRF